jgi:hypothetical protein
MGFDDIDRPRPGCARAGRQPEDVDHLARRVVDDRGAGSRERLEAQAQALVGRAVLGRVAGDRDDVVLGGGPPARGRVQLGAVEAGHEREAVRATGELDRRQA